MNSLNEKMCLTGRLVFIIFDMVESKVATIFDEIPCHECVWRSGIIAVCILNHGTRWR
jgi:hypothetical protein